MDANKEKPPGFPVKIDKFGKGTVMRMGDREKGSISRLFHTGRAGS